MEFGVETVVLSLGLKNCLRNNPRKTIEESLLSLTEVAGKTFPNATVFIPLINESPGLKKEQKNSIKCFNNLVFTIFPFLTALKKEVFKVEIDNIHWTPETAKSTLAHWLDQIHM